jgi:hypothetical protein
MPADQKPTITHRGRTFTVLFPDLLRPLHGEERERLRASIRTDGVQVGVIVDEHDGVIDGRNRLTEAALLNADVPIVVRAGLTEEQKLRLALDLNDARRHLTPGDRKQAQARAEELRKERVARVAEAKRQGKSTRTIAEEEGVSQTQVQADLKAATEQGCSVESDSGKVQGKDGKERPASRKAEDEKHRRWKAEQAADLQSGFNRSAAEAAQEDKAGAPAGHPHSDRIERLVRLANDGLKEVRSAGGIQRMLAEVQGWDWSAMGGLLTDLWSASGRLQRVCRDIEDHALREWAATGKGDPGKETPQEKADRENFHRLFRVREQIRDLAGFLRGVVPGLAAACSSCGVTAQEIRSAALELVAVAQEVAQAVPEPPTPGRRPRREVQPLDPDQPEPSRALPSPCPDVAHNLEESAP